MALWSKLSVAGISQARYDKRDIIKLGVDCGDHKMRIWR